MQEEYVDGVEKHDRETQATIERERITTAAVKQLKAEIKEEKSKHEEEVSLLLQASASSTASHLPKKKCQHHMPLNLHLLCLLPDDRLEPIPCSFHVPGLAAALADSQDAPCHGMAVVIMSENNADRKLLVDTKKGYASLRHCVIQFEKLEV